MKWIKKGRIFYTDGRYKWSKTHTALPTPLIFNDQILRIFYTSRDDSQQSRISFFDVDASDFSSIVNVYEFPILELGGLGTLDDKGHTSSFIFQNGDRYFFYFNGYNIGTTARYRVGVGLACSDRNLYHFDKYSTGPVMDRSIYDPCGAATPFIMQENGIYKMWYTSFLKWEMLNDIPEPFYCIKYAISNDAIHWSPTGDTCIPLQNDEGGIVRPSVVKIDGIYYMWYSIRKNTNYRENRSNSYRIGYAVSKDGINWTRKDEDVGIDVSDEGWDSEMVAYPYVFQLNGVTYMLYNGNGFGKSGIGYAVLSEG